MEHSEIPTQLQNVSQQQLAQTLAALNISVASNIATETSSSSSPAVGAATESTGGRADTTALGSGAHMFTGASHFKIQSSTFQTGHIIINQTFNMPTESKVQVPLGYYEGMSALPSATSEFIGREDIISSDKFSLEAHFFQQQPSLTQKKQQRYLLWGLGGAGKTQIALQFASQFEDRFSKIFFIHANSENNIQASFFDIAKQVGIAEPTSWESGKNWLQKHKEEWLLIYDNADDPNLNLSALKLLPACAHGNIIITSRNQNLSRLTIGSAGKAMEVKSIDQEDAVKLLLIYSGVDLESVSSEEKEIARRIAQTVHYFPLALVQAGSYIQDQNCFSEYLERYHSIRAELLVTNMDQSFDDYTLSVYSTWNLSWAKLKDPTKWFMRVCSHMHFENIPREIFQKSVTNMDQLKEKHPGLMIDKITMMLEKLFSVANRWNISCMDEIISQLKSFSLIQLTKNNTFNIHPLVHQWVFDGIDGQSLYEVVTGIVAASMHNISQNSMEFVLLMQEHCNLLKPLDFHEPFIWESFRKLWTLSGHHKRALELTGHLLFTLQQKLGTEHPDTLTQTYNLALTFKELGRYKDSLELEEPLLELSKLILGGKHSDTLSRARSLAVTYQELGRYNDALLLQEFLLEQVQGQEHPDTLKEVQNLAITYAYLGRHDDAFKLDQSVMKLSERFLGELHPDTLQRRQNLAISLRNLGRFDDAVKLQSPVLESSKRIFGEHHPITLDCTYNLALIYWNLGRYHDALGLAENLVKISERILESHHPKFMSYKQALAFILKDMGKYNDALELEEPLCILSRETLGKAHPNTLTRIQNLAKTYLHLNRPRDALRLGKPLLRLSKRVLGKNHPHTIARIHNLAVIYSTLNRPNEALNGAHTAVALSKEALGENHPDTISYSAFLAHTYRTIGRYQDALLLQEPLIRISKSIFSENHPKIILQTFFLINTYIELERYEDAIHLSKTAIQLSAEVLGINLSNMLVQARYLTVKLVIMEKFNEALSLGEPLLKQLEEVLGMNHPDTLEQVESLGIIYQRLEKYNDALRLQKRLLEASDQVLGRNDPKTLDRMVQLISTYWKLGNYDGALELGQDLITQSEQVLGIDDPKTRLRSRFFELMLRDQNKRNNDRSAGVGSD